MCDYSLSEYANRLAEVGETLFLHVFRSGGGTIGLMGAESMGLRKPKCTCVPHGSRLRVSGINPSLQARFSVGVEEEVKFVQMWMQEGVHRDGIQFSNGRTMNLQEFGPHLAEESITAFVISVGDDGADPAPLKQAGELVAVGATTAQGSQGQGRMRNRLIEFFSGV